MTKLQLTYEKAMRIFYVFSGIFFVLFLIDLSVAIVTGAIVNGQIGENEDWFNATLLPLGIGTFVFLFAGYVFYRMAHKESDLLSVDAYRKSLNTDKDDSISREDLYEKLRRKKDKDPEDGVFAKIGNFFTGIFDSIGNFFSDIFENIAKKREDSKRKSQEKKQMQQELQRIEEEKIKEEQAQRARTKLNKTELIVIVSEQTSLTQNDSRLFVNTFLKVIRDTLIDEDEVKIAKFGKFFKIRIPEVKELDPESNEETIVDAFNDVEFMGFKGLLEAIGLEASEVEEMEEEKQPEPEVVEEIKEEQPEPEVVEEKEEEQPEPEVVEEKEEEQPEPEVVEEKEEEQQEPEVVEEIV
jgi:nucleoid DNA-binding protein